MREPCAPRSRAASRCESRGPPRDACADQARARSGASTRPFRRTWTQPCAPAIGSSAPSTGPRSTSPCAVGDGRGLGGGQLRRPVRELPQRPWRGRRRPALEALLRQPLHRARRLLPGRQGARSARRIPGRRGHEDGPQRSRDLGGHVHPGSGLRTSRSGPRLLQLRARGTGGPGQRLPRSLHRVEGRPRNGYSAIVHRHLGAKDIHMVYASQGGTSTEHRPSSARRRHGP